MSICRLCLNSSASHYENISTVDRQQFELVLPEIDVNLVQSAVICLNCIQLIRSTYSFKSSCLANDKIIQCYAKKIGKRNLRLKDVLQNHGLLTNSENVDVKPTLVIKVENDEKCYENLDIIKDSQKSFTYNICKENFSLKNNLESRKAGHYIDLFCTAGSETFCQKEIKGNSRKSNDHTITHSLEEQCNNSSKFLNGSKSLNCLKEQTLQTDEVKINRSYQCKMCNRLFSNISTLLDHIKVHFERPKCQICKKTYYNMAILKRHFKTVHCILINLKINDQELDSWQDKISFEVNEDKMEETLKMHVGLHENDDKKIIKDDVQEEGNFWEKHYNETTTYECGICKNSYNTKRTFLNHLNTHFIRPKCNFCNSFYYNTHCLQKHVMQMHNDDIKNKIFITGVNKLLNESDDKLKDVTKQHTLILSKKVHFVCDICQASFSSKSHLKRHINSHLGIKNVRNVARRNFICETCGFAVRSRGELTQHVRIHTGEKPHMCAICGKGFAQSSSLGTHKRIRHSTERSFTCEYCSKSFNIKCSLTKHILEVHLIDTIEKKIVCSYCGKKYRLQCQLNAHLKWHIADRKFKCDICDKAFISAHTVRTHRLIHFPDKEHKCEICGKGFHQKCNLNTHMKSHLKLKSNLFGSGVV